MKIITFTKNDIRVDIKFSSEENTVWMSQKDMATLFKKGSHAINNHLRKLDQNGATFHYLWIVAQDGKLREVGHYNLDIIKQVGYKIDPNFTNEFVSWCEGQLNSLNHQNVPIQSNLIRFNNGLIELDVTIEPVENTVYLDKEQLMILFDTTRQNIEYHIANIYECGELDLTPTCKEILQVQKEGNREVTRSIILYNLDLIISLGFRINNKRGIEFRQWANKVLQSYLYKGYAVDENRIKVIEKYYLYLQKDIDEIKEVVSKHNALLSKKESKYIIFYKNQEFDAYDFLCNLIHQANKSIIIVDPYVDEVLLSTLKSKKDNVSVMIITTNKYKISETDISKFETQYGKIEIQKIPTFHDRDIFIDDTLYVLTSSINRLAHYQSMVIRVDNKEESQITLNGFLESKK